MLVQRSIYGVSKQICIFGTENLFNYSSITCQNLKVVYFREVIMFYIVAKVVGKGERCNIVTYTDINMNSNSSINVCAKDLVCKHCPENKNIYVCMGGKYSFLTLF